MNTLHFKLVTPERVLFEEEIVSLTLPTQTGEITILPNHIPLVSTVSDGVAEIKYQNGDLQEIAVAGGFLQVGINNSLTLLADMAERADEIDLNAIEEAKKRAEAVMKEQVHENAESYAEAAAALTKELAKYKAAIRYRQRTSLASIRQGSFHSTPESS